MNIYFILFFAIQLNFLSISTGIPNCYNSQQISCTPCTYPPWSNCYICTPGTCVTCTLYACIQCNNGFYLNSDNSCPPCISPCATCENSSTCYTCINGYYQNAGLCLQCMNPCLSCTSASICQ
jgi:hypothetical protein